MTALEDFIVVNEKITGDIIVTQNTQFNNVDADSMIVEEGVKARLYGTIHKHLLIKKEARVFLHGQLLGKLEEQGGRLYHFDE